MVNNGGNVLVDNRAVIKKMYFPRVVFVLAKSLFSLVEVAINALILLILSLWIGYPLSVNIIFAPLFVIATLILGLGFSLWMNALTVRQRDLHQFVPTIIGFLIWLTPVFYPVTLIPAKYSFVLYFNPMAGIIQGFRWALFDDQIPSLWYIPSFVFAVVLFVSGVLYFIKVEEDLVDYV